MKTVLAVSGLRKRYGKIHALQGIELNVEKGQVHGILGPNGSGKTTTLGIILGIIHPTGGSFSWFGGVSSIEARKNIGALLEQPNFYPYLSARKNLEIIAHIKGVAFDQINDHLKLTGLYSRADDKIKTYSFGMKQRLGIAATMTGDPEVLIFDEPVNGLDPEGISEIREIILRLAGQGKTIIMASHILDEVEKVCDYVTVLRNGQIIAAGSVGELLHTKPVYNIAADDMEALEQAVVNTPDIKILSNEQILKIQTDEDVNATDLNRLMIDKGIYLSLLYREKKTLEAKFLELVKAQA